MSVPAYVYSFYSVGYKSVAFGTPIDYPIPAQDGKKLALIDGRCTAAGTAHTLSILYANDSLANPGSSRNTASAGALAAQAHIFTTVAPKDPAGNAAAANDIVAYQCTDGTWEFNTVSGLAGSDITLNTNLAKPIAAGAKVMIFGVVADNSRFALAIPASVQTKYGEGRVCIVHPYTGEPFFVSDNNATATGSIDNLLFAYINK
jgi:hypothetical protein